MSRSEYKLFLCGDVMTGRGIDQILRVRSDPVLHEAYVRDARDYVRLAERLNGPLPRSVEETYIWGDGLKELAARQPDLRVVNLETSITKSDDREPKGINYRMHPGNIGCLKAAKIDICALGNNHVLDYGRPGLLETMKTLTHAGIKTCGAGQTEAEASAPAEFTIAATVSVLVFSVGVETSGVPPSWRAAAHSPGVNFLPDLSATEVSRFIERLKEERKVRLGDRAAITIVSVHWGDNWGYELSSDELHFARRLIDEAGVDLVHGHSSHHAKAIEIYRDRLILYGCGDLINDYEGIRGHEEFRPDLSLMYFPTLDAKTGELLRLEMTATQMMRFRVCYARSNDTAWLAERLTRECQRFGLSVAPRGDHSLILE